jgi:hypothetical protein
MNKELNKFKHTFALLIIILFINYNIVHILGKLLLPENYYINGQLKKKPHQLLMLTCFILSFIIEKMFKKYINIDKIKINKYLKDLLFFILIIIILKGYNRYLKKTDNMITDNKKHSIFSYYSYPKYNIETVMSQFIIYIIVIILVYNL